MKMRIIATILCCVMAMLILPNVAKAEPNEAVGCIRFSSENEFTVSFGSKTWDGTIEYSQSGSYWLKWSGKEVKATKDGDIYTLYFRGKNNQVVSKSSSYFHLKGTGISCDGNIENLLDYEKVANNEHPTMKANCFSRLFANCTGLVSAPELGAVQLSNACYSHMFEGCTSLKTAPELPATELAQHCYDSMFMGCTALTAAPVLPADKLQMSCYLAMFSDCTALTTVPNLVATELAENCCEKMFQGCTALKTAPALPTMSLAKNCYNSMFANCTALVNPPALPAVQLADECYAMMFAGCLTLDNAPALPAMDLADFCYYYMFAGCPITTAPELNATELKQSCYSNMFAGCTSLKQAPVLPATELANACYYFMFEGCSSLKTAPALPAMQLAPTCYWYMFGGCTALEKAPRLPAMETEPRCYGYMFEGCTSLTLAPELPATIITEDCYDCMLQGCTGIDISETPDDVYCVPWRVPTSGMAIEAHDWDVYMLDGTSGPFTGNPKLGVTYYERGTHPIILEPMVDEMIVVSVGDVATMSVDAVGKKPMSYQWQVDRNDGSGYTNIVGATESEYKSNPCETKNNGYRYRCIVKNELGEAVSVLFTLCVSDVPQMGDASAPILLIALMLLSALGLILLPRKERRV